MSEITIHTGSMGDRTPIQVEWFDHNNERYTDSVVIAVENRDKPRTLTVSINGRVVWQRNDRGQVYS